MIEETEQLKVIIANNRDGLGIQAAEAVFQKIEELLKVKSAINMIFAAAPSQNEFLSNLLKKPIEWQRINAFHMDEYVGLRPDAPQGFGNFLRERLFEKAPFKAVHLLNGNAADLEEECQRYSALLHENPTDIVCMGIGENAHIAFNDPHVADFNDAQLVKIVDLDEACRMQQVNDGCFKRVEEVPTHALTLTVPALFRGDFIFCMVPGEKKATAVYNTLTAEIAERYPSSVLRTHPSAILFLDKESSKLLPET